MHIPSRINSLQHRSLRKIDGHLGESMEEIADDLIAYDHDDVDEMGLGIACCKEGVDQLRIGLSALDNGIFYQLGEGIDFGVKGSWAPANFQDLLVRKSVHLS